MSKEFLPSWLSHSPSVLTILATVCLPRLLPSLLKLTMAAWPGVPWTAVLAVTRGDLRKAKMATDAAAIPPAARKARRVTGFVWSSRVGFESKMMTPQCCVAGDGTEILA
jgi:hypothetical protein